ncbi:hypothetical protein PP304_gp141 [Gordonia phage Phendrix]|uniref:Uncharacterized protein n=1 Tax=Gordonia phage Phendrix TaxID=2593335 RepID=A0A514U199_9CAUD|nr:hypothetical protein PP304_gp141 [Gordonia phage Phendrix]QDK02728.1 hypothetical protein SEA_PHENDRIX_212 [Gordonia phage Phendrix]
MSDLLLDMAVKHIKSEAVTPQSLQRYLAGRKQKVYGDLVVEPSPNNILVAQASEEFAELMRELADHPNISFEYVSLIELAMANELVYNMPEVTNPGYAYKTPHWLSVKMRWVKSS